MDRLNAIAAPTDPLLARWMDPTTGTFLSVDPVVAAVGDPQSYNGYAYARNNPVSYNDPTGKDIEIITITAAPNGHTYLSWMAMQDAAIGGALAAVASQFRSGEAHVVRGLLEGTGGGGAPSSQVEEIVVHGDRSSVTRPFGPNSVYEFGTDGMLQVTVFGAEVAGIGALSGPPANPGPWQRDVPALRFNTDRIDSFEAIVNLIPLGRGFNLGRSVIFGADRTKRIRRSQVSANQQARDAANEVNLNRAQRARLQRALEHESRVEGRNLSYDDIVGLARDIKNGYIP